ncbi:DUF2577 domain-containing protein [Paenibacillus elgii]|uniref:DUF2577 domain-containing protein n=1 Tax=Paenibacillus elgii TaxID=189691 RepID=UPI0020405571|nr:DUF2577 domain-containing protein [Paenibacillus elgii]MCM3273653.1 DUF2577 domain-containing protein [Paenibacillus elgii]
MSLLDLVKRAALDAVEAQKPVGILFGKVTKKSPLEVFVDQRFTLTEDFLILPEQLTELKIDLKHTHGGSGEALTEPIVIRKGLEDGDRVILLRMQGGLNYLIIDRVVTA